MRKATRQKNIIHHGCNLSPHAVKSVPEAYGMNTLPIVGYWEILAPD